MGVFVSFRWRRSFSLSLAAAVAATTDNDGDDDGAELTMGFSANTMGVGGQMAGHLCAVRR